MALLGVVFLTQSLLAGDGSELLKEAGVEGGLVVHLGCGDGSLTAQLRAGEQYIVHGLDPSAENVGKARESLRARGVYGPVSVDLLAGSRLPYADNLVNLIVVEDPAGVPETELLRALAPRGVILSRRDGKWVRTVKPLPAGMDEWTHYLHGPDGNPVARDTSVGPPKRLQWVGSPRWSRHHDHMASMTALVSAMGRLFYIFDEGPAASIWLPSRWRLIARDAFNGTILWKRKIEQWNTRQYPLKSGPAHLLRRLVAVGERVYVTLGIDAPVTALGAATGETVLTYEGSEHTREIVVSGGVVFLVADTSPSHLPEFKRKDTYVWANTQKANPGWGWQGNTRRILAYNAETGQRLWQADHPVAPCSLAADGERIVFHDGSKLLALARADGSTLWETEAVPTKIPVPTNTGPRVLIYEDVILCAPNNGRISGWDAKSGKKLWEQPQRPSGHQSLKDLLVVDGLVWTGAIAGSGDSGIFTGYDPRTGKVQREFSPDVKVHWFHHRCYPAKGAGEFILTARNGTEYINLETEHWKPHHWFRGGCIYGVMPCNGMTYASMNDCGCQLEAKIIGFNALAPGPVPEADEQSLSGAARLEKGPAYGRVDGPAAGPADWPTYRHDVERSGASRITVSPRLGPAWKTALGGRLSAPTVAAGKVLVASIDTHTLHALDAATGRSLWSFTAGARIDSPPTYYRGLVLFGSADGFIYALRATDGALAWRFRGAPVDCRLMAWEQLESAWPVHGSVLIHKGVLYATAGRNMYLDGGLRLIRLNAVSGELLGETIMNDRDPESGEDMHLAYLKKTQGNTMPVAHSDILSCDGRHIWLRSQKITLQGKRIEIGLKSVQEQPPEDFHIFCQNGFLDDSYFFRSYWTYGRRVSGGYGGWFQAGQLVPSGRILCVDDQHVYGYGRKPAFMINASVLEYQLFAADRTVTAEAIANVQRARGRMNTRSPWRNASSSDWRLRYFFPDSDLSAVLFRWKLDQPSMITRAMVVAGDTLFVAGPPDLIDERRAFRHPDESGVEKTLARQARAFDGSLGGQLWALEKASGQPVARYQLDSIPVFDGMAAAGGSLFMTTVKGEVIAFGPGALTPLARADDQPLRIAWDQPEDPGYLLPPEVPKDDEFARVSRCKVIASGLGYRLEAAGRKRVGLALKKLDRPVGGSFILRARMKAVANSGNLLSNGYLAFGDGEREPRLIKCGARLRARQALIVQGTLGGGTSATGEIKPPGAGELDLVVKVDLPARKITFSFAGVTLAAEIARAIQAVTHVGYIVDGAVMDFTPITVEAGGE